MAAFPRYCAPRKSRPAAQRSGDQEGDGRPDHPQGAGDPACEKEQCVGTCDRGLDEGAAHRRCVTSLLRSLSLAVTTE